MRQGYIKVHRRIHESAVWKKPPIYARVWHYLLSAAAWKPGDGLRRGECYASLASIQEGVAWERNGRKQMPSKTTIHRVMRFLVAEQMVEQSESRVFISKYEEFQGQPEGIVEREAEPKKKKKEKNYIFALPNVGVTYAEHQLLKAAYPEADMEGTYMDISKWCRANDQWPTSIVPLVHKWMEKAKRKGKDGKPKLVY